MDRIAISAEELETIQRELHQLESAGRAQRLGLDDEAPAAKKWQRRSRPPVNGAI